MVPQWTAGRQPSAESGMVLRSPLGARRSGFLGIANARLTTPQQFETDLLRQIEDVFMTDGSPFARYSSRLKRETYAPDDLSHCYFRKRNASDFDLAVSSTSADRTIVAPMVQAMKADGLRVNWYELPECRMDDEAKVMPFMNSLNKQPCIVLFLSDAYLRNDPEKNPYCIWELASAIMQMVKGHRSPERTLVVYRKGGDLTSQKLDAASAYVLRAMGMHFHNGSTKNVGKILTTERRLPIFVSGPICSMTRQITCISFTSSVAILDVFPLQRKPGRNLRFLADHR